MIPGTVAPVGDMECPVVFGSYQPGYLFGQVSGISGGKDLVVDYPQLVSLPGKSHHCLDKITTFAAGTGSAKQTGSSDDEMPGTEVPDRVFAGQFGLTIGVRRDRDIGFSIGGGASLIFTAEDIIGAEMNQSGAQFQGGRGHISGP